MIRPLLIAALLVVGCKSRDATSDGGQPTIESLGNHDVCFPARQPDHRAEPPAATVPTTQSE